jgi:hypothetical protein
MAAPVRVLGRAIRGAVAASLFRMSSIKDAALIAELRRRMMGDDHTQQTADTAAPPAVPAVLRR